MLNQKWYYSLGVAIPLVTTLLLWGIFKAIFNLDINTNIANTGITLGIVFGIANLFLTWAIFKKRV